MKEIIRSIFFDINQYYYGHRKFALLAIFCVIYLFIFEKDVRRKFIWPLFIIVLVVINPILYKYIFNKIIYRRLFWLFSDTLLVGLSFILIIKKINNEKLKQLFFILICFLICMLGEYQFNKKDIFQKKVNNYKLPYGVIEVCDYLLSVDDDPRCIMDGQLYCYVRQVSSNIKLLYGRNIEGYISKASDDARYIYNCFSDGNYGEVLDFANKNSYKFIVTENREIDLLILSEYGFKKVFCCDSYNVYQGEFDS